MDRRVTRRLTPRAPRFDGFVPTSTAASQTARAIRRADTKAELALRRAMWALGLRYRKNAAHVPGRPDILFARARTLVFCDGDFWHGRNWSERKRKLLAGNNAAYWIAKIEANMARDTRLNAELAREGWHVLRFWETDVLHDPIAVARKVAATISARRTKPSLVADSAP